MARPYYHDSLIPMDLRKEGWKSFVSNANGSESESVFNLEKLFRFKDFNSVERFVTMIDRLETDYQVHNTVIVDKYDNTVVVRLSSPQFKVPSIIEVNFARMVTIRYYNQQQTDSPKPYLFIDFDGTVRCVVSTGDEKKPFRAPTECEEVEVFPQAVERLKQARDEGYFIVGVTNQSGITSRGIPVSKIEACIEETKRQLEIDFPVYFADNKDEYYKPAIGMGIESIQQYGAIDFEQSLMVGDNHRNGDRGFAEGMGIEFQYAATYFDLTDEQMRQCGKVEEEFNVELLGDASTSELSKIDAYDLATSDVVTGDFTTDSLKFSVLRKAEAPLKEESIEAPYEVKVYVPSTAIDEPVTEREFRRRILETQEFLSTLFGGFTTLQAKGGYMSDMEGLITEPVVVVATWAGRQDYEERLEDLEAFLRAKRMDWEQEVIGFEFENDFFMFPEYQEAAAEFFLAESKMTRKEEQGEGFFKDAEKNLQKYISQMLGMARPTTFTNDEGEQIVVNQGYGTEEDHRILEEYEKWLFKNCESLMVERGEYFSCTMRYQAKMKECYYNSLMYSWEDADAQYYEGWVVSESLSLPIRHAWIVKDGQVFDPTFDVLRRDRGSKKDERIYYYGTHIPSDFIRLFMIYSSYAGPYLFDYFFYDTYGEDAYDEFAGKEPQGSLEFSRSALRQMANPFMAEGDNDDA